MKIDPSWLNSALCYFDISNQLVHHAAMHSSSILHVRITPHRVPTCLRLIELHIAH